MYVHWSKGDAQANRLELVEYLVLVSYHYGMVEAQFRQLPKKTSQVVEFVYEALLHWSYYLLKQDFHLPPNYPIQ